MPRSAVTATPSPRIAKIAAGLRSDMEFTRVETPSAPGMPAEVTLSRGRAGGGSFPGKFPDSTSAWRGPARPVAGYDGNPPSPTRGRHGQMRNLRQRLRQVLPSEHERLDPHLRQLRVRDPRAGADLRELRRPHRRPWARRGRQILLLRALR